MDDLLVGPIFEDGMLPCPFCGGRPTLWPDRNGEVSPYCEDCGAGPADHCRDVPGKPLLPIDAWLFARGDTEKALMRLSRLLQPAPPLVDGGLGGDPAWDMHRARFLAAEAFSEEQMRLVAGANIVGRHNVADVKRSLAEHPAEQIVGLVEAMAANPRSAIA